VIVILLSDSFESVIRPSISEDINGHLMLCEDGLDSEDSKRIVYACPCCHSWLFNSSTLRWSARDGYWLSPGHTLTDQKYNSENEIITCPGCEWATKLEFFSSFG